jgi:hypothetical protein
LGERSESCQARTSEIRFKRLSGGVPTRVLPERQYQSIAVSDHHLTLRVRAVRGTRKGVGTARAQLHRQRVDPCYVDVGVIGAFGSAGANFRPIAAIKEQLDVVPHQNREDARCASTARYLES